MLPSVHAKHILIGRGSWFDELTTLLLERRGHGGQHLRALRPLGMPGGSDVIDEAR